MNFSEIRTSTFRRVEEDASDPAFFDTSEVDDAINEGWEDLAVKTEWYRDVVTMAAQDEITYYDLREFPSGIILVERIWDQNTERWLTPDSVEGIQRHSYYRWEAITGQPVCWFMRGFFWLGIFPKVAYSDTAHRSVLLDVHVRAVPPPLVDDNYELPFPEEFHEAIIHYAAAELHSQEGELDLVIDHWRQYLALAARMRQWVQSVGEAAVHRHHGGRVGKGTLRRR